MDGSLGGPIRLRTKYSFVSVVLVINWLGLIPSFCARTRKLDLERRDDRTNEVDGDRSDLVSVLRLDIFMDTP